MKRIYQHPQAEATGASALVFDKEALAAKAAAGDEGIAGSAGSNRFLRHKSSFAADSPFSSPPLSIRPIEHEQASRKIYPYKLLEPGR